MPLPALAMAENRSEDGFARVFLRVGANYSR